MTLLEILRINCISLASCLVYTFVSTAQQLEFIDKVLSGGRHKEDPPTYLARSRISRCLAYAMIIVALNHEFFDDRTNWIFASICGPAIFIGGWYLLKRLGM